MREIIVAQICVDNEGSLTVLDTEGRVWSGYWSQKEGGWVWTRVTLPQVNP
jgi:hypothetical protein